MQRRKGANGENEVCALLTDAFGLPGKLKRRLGQARDGEHDIDLPPLRIEVKRRARIANLYEWIDQCSTGSHPGDIPVVMLRADMKGWLVCLELGHFIKLAREEIVAWQTRSDPS